MVEFTNLSSLSNNSGIGDILGLPNATNPFFWGWMIVALFAIFTLSMHYAEKKLKGEGKILSSLAISSLLCIVLAVIGSVVGFITLEVLVYVLVVGLLLIAIWIFN